MRAGNASWGSSPSHDPDVAGSTVSRVVCGRYLIPRGAWSRYALDLLPLTVPAHVARYFYPNRHNDRRLWLHAFCGLSFMASLQSFPPSALSCLHPRRAWSCMDNDRHTLQLCRILYLQSRQRRKKRLQKRKEPKELSSFRRLSVAEVDGCFEDLQFFTTESGSKLLISGWWGRSRHPNYLYAQRFLLSVHFLCSIRSLKRGFFNGPGMVIPYRIQHPNHLCVFSVPHRPPCS